MAATTDEALGALASAIGEQLAAKRLTLCTAESCTGGWIAKTVTDIAGSSAWFDCGLAAYSYEAKQGLLGVRPETLEHFGAVSRETVIEMVSGALVHSALLQPNALTYRAPSWLKSKAGPRALQWRVVALDKAGVMLSETGRRSVRFGVVR